MNDDKMIYYWAHMLDEAMNEFPAGKAFLDSVLPKNGVIIYDEHGKKLDFGIKLNQDMVGGWSALSKDGKTIIALSDFNSGYDGKDISIPALAKFLQSYGYELIDER